MRTTFNFFGRQVVLPSGPRTRRFLGCYLTVLIGCWCYVAYLVCSEWGRVLDISKGWVFLLGAVMTMELTFHGNPRTTALIRNGTLREAIRVGFVGGAAYFAHQSGTTADTVWLTIAFVWMLVDKLSARLRPEKPAVDKVSG